MHAEQQPHYSPQRRGWPLWALAPAIPLAAALGVVAGIALATYTGAGAPPATVQGTDQPSQSNHQTWQIPGAVLPETPVLPPVTMGDAVTQPDLPEGVYFQGVPRDIREARLALLTDYRTYEGPAGAINLDYQQMRNGGYGISVVGILTVEGYENWVQAQQTDPEALEHWLTQAAARVQQAALKDRFRVAWAVVDVLRQRPEGFTDDEVTQLDNGSYLVIRPLATTADYDKAEVLIRPLPDDSGEVATTGKEPWSVYGPVILFTSQDYYRPAGTLNAHPLH